MISSGQATRIASFFLCVLSAFLLSATPAAAEGGEAEELPPVTLRVD